MEWHTTAIFDAAQHIVEPPDLWTSRLPSKHREAAPRVVPFPGGGEAWSFDGGALLRPLGLEVAAGFSPLELRTAGYSYSTIRKGAYDPAERLRDMAIDEIDAACIFPTFATAVRHLGDRDLQLACVQAYNDSVLEWTREGDASRLLPQALMPTTGADAALAEAQRAVKAGFRGVVFNGWPGGGADPSADEEPFWAFCQEAGLVISLLRGGPGILARTGGEPLPPDGVPEPLEMLWAGRANAKGTNLALFIYTGILERFPNLRIALIETGAGWVPPYLEESNNTWRRARFWVDRQLRYTPSDYFQRQVTATVEGDRVAIEAREDVGVGSMMWASGYPSVVSATVWPGSRLAIEEQFRGVPDIERRRILWDNAAALFGVPALEAVGQVR